MKKIFLVTIFVFFSSISFAEIATDWKWGKVFNSVVLISGENIPEITTNKGPFEPDVGPHEKQPKFDSLKPRIIPYGMGTGFFINKFHIVTNYHVIKNFNKLEVDSKKILELYNIGKSRKYISRATRTSIHPVNRILRENGITEFQIPKVTEETKKKQSETNGRIRLNNPVCGSQEFCFRICP